MISSGNGSIISSIPGSTMLGTMLHQWSRLLTSACLPVTTLWIARSDTLFASNISHHQVLFGRQAFQLNDRPMYVWLAWQHVLTCCTQDDSPSRFYTLLHLVWHDILLEKFPSKSVLMALLCSILSLHSPPLNLINVKTEGLTSKQEVEWRQQGRKCAWISID